MKCCRMTDGPREVGGFDDSFRAHYSSNRGDGVCIAGLLMHARECLDRVWKL